MRNYCLIIFHYSVDILSLEGRHEDGTVTVGRHIHIVTQYEVRHCVNFTVNTANSWFAYSKKDLDSLGFELKNHCLEMSLGFPQRRERKETGFFFSFFSFLNKCYMFYHICSRILKETRLMRTWSCHVTESRQGAKWIILAGEGLLLGAAASESSSSWDKRQHHPHPSIPHSFYLACSSNAAASVFKAEKTHLTYNNLLSNRTFFFPYTRDEIEFLRRF